MLCNSRVIKVTSKHQPYQLYVHDWTHVIFIEISVG